MKTLDVVAAVLLVIGGANWGLIGLFGFDLVGTLLGDMSLLTRLIYSLVGLGALYQALTWKAIQRRWALARARI